MANKSLWLGIGLVLVSLVFPLIGESQEPALNQSAIMVTRDTQAIVPLFKMEIYINDRKYQESKRTIFGNVKYEDHPIKLGETVTIPINDGVHSIYVKAGTMESNKVAFTAEKNITSFIIFIEEGQLVLVAR